MNTIRHLITGILLILGLSNLAQSQNKQEDNNQESIYAKECLQIAHQLTKESAVEAANVCAVEAADSFLQLQDWTEFYNCYRLVTANAFRFHNHSDAIVLFQEALQELQGLDKKSDCHQTIGLLHHLQSAVYHHQGRYQKSIQSGTKAIDILEQFDNAPHLERVYYNLANAYNTESVDFYKSIQYSKRALQIHFRQPEIDSNRISKLYVLLGRAYRGLLQYQNAIEAYQTGKNYRNGWDSQISYLLSMVYLDEKDCKRALEFAEKSLELSLQEKQIDSDTYLRLALAHSCNKNREQALFYYQKAVNSSKENYGNTHPDYAKTLVYLGDFYQTEETLDKALANYQAALQALEPDFTSSNSEENPNISAAYSSIWTIEAIRNKAGVFQQKSQIENPQHYLQLALTSYELVLQNIEFRRQQYTSDESKHYILNYVYDTYESAIKVSFKIYQLTQDKHYLQKTFQLIEASKASVLKEAVHESALFHLNQIPQDLLEELEEVKITLAQIEKEQYDLKKRLPIDSTAMANNQLQSLEVNRQKEQLIQELSQYPDYTKIKYVEKPPTFQEVQKALKPEQVILEYFVGKKEVYTCLLTQDTIIIYQQNKTAGFEAQIETLLHTLNNWNFVVNSTQEATDKYVQTSVQLYEYLLAEPLKQLKTQKQITFVPDGILGYVPFEVLLSHAPEDSLRFQDYPYLLKDYTISYAYASALWLEKEQTKNNSKNAYTFAGFAPIYSPSIAGNFQNDSLLNEQERSYLLAMNVRGGLSDLVYAREIVGNLADLLNGQTWLAEAATKENFQKTAANHGVLHLAMHGVIDDKNPLYSHLIFTKTDEQKDNRLTAAELYNMQFNAGLAVLSACNTGVGELKRGEGIMSLSRAFAFAGCPSMVMSLWSVPDEQTGILMEYFYKELKAGATKDEALRQAKLQYLEEQDNRGAHPYLWAGFVVIGDTDSIDFDESRSWFTWMVIGLGLFLLIVAARRFLRLQ
ncbi:MAG: CHAT domain-containing protein [Chitinophagales bacterium]